MATIFGPTVEEWQEKRAIAWVMLLAQAKKSPVTIRFTGDNEKWLWQIDTEEEFLALQGTELQVLESIN